MVRHAFRTLTLPLLAAPALLSTWSIAGSPASVVRPSPAFAALQPLPDEIAFVRQDLTAHANNLEIRRQDGTISPLTDYMEVPGVLTFAWSPDGMQLAYFAATSMCCSLRLINVDGSDDHEIMSGGIIGEGLSWTAGDVVVAGDTKLAYVTPSTCTSDGCTNALHVATLRDGDIIDDTALTTPHPYAQWTVSRPSWSPDGFMLAYKGAGAPSGQTPEENVWLIGAGGSDPHRLTNAAVNEVFPHTAYGGPSWSPDGTSIAAAKEVLQSSTARENDLVTLDPTSGDETLVSHIPCGLDTPGPAWAAGGTELLFTSIDHTNCPGIQRIDTDTKSMEQVTNGIDFTPAVRPAKPTVVSLTLGGDPVVADRRGKDPLHIGDFMPVACTGERSDADWLDCSKPPDGNPEKVWPVILRRGGTFQIRDAVIKIPDSITLTDAAVRASADFGYGQVIDLVQHATSADANGDVDLKNMSVEAGKSATLPNYAGYWPSLTIHCSIEQGDQTWDAGTTSVPVYETFNPEGVPSIGDGGTDVDGTRYLTVVDFGTEAAQGQNTENGTFDAIWKALQTRHIAPMSLDPTTGIITPETDTILQYGPAGWTLPGFVTNTNKGSCDTLGGLLRSGLGTCGAWPSFMAYVLAAQGLQVSTTYVRSLARFPGPPGTASNCGSRLYTNMTQCTYMLVKPWSFSSPVRAPDPIYDYLDRFLLGRTGQLLWLPTDKRAVYVGSAIGQGAPLNPPGLFRWGDYVVASYKGQVYDPSYGTGPFVDGLDWARQALDGYAILSPNPCVRGLCTFKAHKGVM